MEYENEFYKEICNAVSAKEHKEICDKYNKDFKLVMLCIEQSLDIDMMSSTTMDRDTFHKTIQEQLKLKSL